MNVKKWTTIFWLGFSSGLPLALGSSTLQAWLTESHVDLTLIGFFTLVSSPYSLKFLWAPLMDRFAPFGLERAGLGKRKGWILLTQVLLALAVSQLGIEHPENHLTSIALLTTAVCFLSASQDIVIDAYRIELLKPTEFGAGSSIATLGYRLGMIVSSSFTLILADHFSWKIIFWILASVALLNTLVHLVAPPIKGQLKMKDSIFESYKLPLQDLFKRKDMVSTLAFLLTYKMDVSFTLALMTTFLLGLGFTKTEIGAVSKGFGIIATLLGTTVGGGWFLKLGLERSLWVFGLLQGISSVFFILLARIGHSYPMMVAAISAENFFSGMGNAAYGALIMSLCNPRFTGAQFALLTSVMAFTRQWVQAPSGYLAKNLGWETYYIVSLLLMVPSLLILSRFHRWKLFTNRE